MAAARGRGGTGDTADTLPMSVGEPAGGHTVRGSASPRERTVQVNGQPCRVWEKGDGEPLFFLAGLVGLPRWTPVLDLLAKQRRVIAPSLPGFHGSAGHDVLDSHLDWITATLDLLEAAGLDEGDLMGVSLGGSLAAEVAALSPPRVRRLVLACPFGLFDDREPAADVFAQRPSELDALLCSKPELLAALRTRPEGCDEIEWQVLGARAAEAAARLLWPLGDTGLARRLHRICARTLLLWGSDDRVLPGSYARRIAAGIAGPVELHTLAGAGHLLDLDAPETVAENVLTFLA